MLRKFVLTVFLASLACSARTEPLSHRVELDLSIRPTRSGCAEEPAVYLGRYGHRISPICMTQGGWYNVDQPRESGNAILWLKLSSPSNRKSARLIGLGFRVPINQGLGYTEVRWRGGAPYIAIRTQF